MTGDGHRDLVSATPRYAYPAGGEGYINKWSLTMHPYDARIDGFWFNPPIGEFHGESLTTKIEDIDIDGDKDITLYLERDEIYLQQDNGKFTRL